MVRVLPGAEDYFDPDELGLDPETVDVNYWSRT